MYRKTGLVRSAAGGVEAGCESVVCQNIILNISQGTSLKAVVEGSLVVAITLSYAVILVPAREHVERFFISRLRLSQGWAVMASKNAIRTALVLSTSVVAVLSPYFGAVLGAIGGALS